jgi:hypothetical protein
LLRRTRQGRRSADGRTHGEGSRRILSPRAPGRRRSLATRRRLGLAGGDARRVEGKRRSVTACAYSRRCAAGNSPDLGRWRRDRPLPKPGIGHDRRREGTHPQPRCSCQSTAHPTQAPSRARRAASAAVCRQRRGRRRARGAPRPASGRPRRVLRSSDAARPRLRRRTRRSGSGTTWEASSSLGLEGWKGELRGCCGSQAALASCTSRASVRARSIEVHRRKPEGVGSKSSKSASGQGCQDDGGVSC